MKLPNGLEVCGVRDPVADRICVAPLDHAGVHGWATLEALVDGRTRAGEPLEQFYREAC